MNKNINMKIINARIIMEGLKLIEQIDNILAKDYFHEDYIRKRDNLMYIVGVRGNLVKEKKSTYCPVSRRKPEQISGLRKRQKIQREENVIKREQMKQKHISRYANCDTSKLPHKIRQKLRLWGVIV